MHWLVDPVIKLLEHVMKVFEKKRAHFCWCILLGGQLGGRARAQGAAAPYSLLAPPMFHSAVNCLLVVNFVSHSAVGSSAYIDVIDRSLRP